MQEQQSTAQLRLASQAFGAETAILAKKLAAALAKLAATQKALSSLQVIFVHFMKAGTLNRCALRKVGWIGHAIVRAVSAFAVTAVRKLRLYNRMSRQHV